ncbi:hypothetical protein Bbelb_383830 [Branchiostoma belcheri]|nr:hypothetical protein Bbelb_383830 [Branchiostoma belcheri]
MSHSTLRIGKVELLLEEEDEEGRQRLHANHLVRKQLTKEDIENILTKIIAKTEEPGFDIGVLWLNSNGLEALPDDPARGRDFSKLENLIQLALWDNKFAVFLEVLVKLKRLERLNISQNVIERIPPSIKEMSAGLKELWLGGNRIQNVPEDLCYLANLEILYLGHRQYKDGGNMISDLPKNFGQLKKLHTLYLYANKFTKLPEVIFQLPSLRDLDAGKNTIRHLPEEMHHLKKLTMLKVDDNLLTELPNALCRLNNLFKLDIRGNSITFLPVEFGKLTQLKIFDIKRNPLVQPPLDVCLQGVGRIKTYQEELAKSEPVSTVHRKVVLLGESFAGKTSLKNALQTDESHLTEEKDRTQCMNIDSWCSEIDGESLEIRVCDFGGHDVYRLTHQFFLSEGSLHLLVVNLKTYRRQKSAFNKAVKFWLESVDSRVVNAVVYLVGTHADRLTAKQIEEKTRDIKARVATFIEERMKHMHLQIEEVEKQIDKARGEVVNTGNGHANRKLEQLQRKAERLQCKLESGLRLVKDGEIAVVSSNKDLTGISDLKADVFKISVDKDMFPSAHCILPRSWINMEKLLRSEGQKSTNITLSWEECVHLGSKFDLDSTGLEAVMEYLHKTGSVLHYKGDILRNVVFPDPTQLITLLKLIFDHDRDRLLGALRQNSQMSAEDFSLVEKNFICRAILPKDILHKHFSKNRTTSDDFETTIKVLETFGITHVVPPMPKGTPGTAFLTPGDTYYRFPWFLPRSQGTPSYVKQCWPSRVPNGVEQIGVEFRINGKEPTGLFERLCAQLPPQLCPGNDWSDGALSYMGEQPVLVRRKTVEGGVKIMISGRVRADSDRIDDMWLYAIIPIVEKTKLLLKEWSRSCWTCSIPCPHCTKAGLKVLGYFRGDLLWEERPDKPAKLPCPRPRHHSGRAAPTLMTKLVYPPKAVPTVAPTDVVVKPASSTEMEVSVGPGGIPVHLRPGVILGYIVKYKGDGREAKEVPMKNGQHTVTLRGLSKSTKYTVTVAGFTAGGVGKESDPIDIFTMEDVPDAPPVDVTAFARSTREIKVFWKEPPKDQCNGAIRGYNVRYRGKNDTGAYSLVFTENTHAVLQNLELAKEYSIAVQALTSIGEGPFSHQPVAKRTLLDDPKDGVMEDVTDMLVDKLLVEDIRRLAVKLGLTEVQYEEVCYSCDRDAREIKYQMLRKWKQVTGNNATVQSLCTALEALDAKVSTPAEHCRTVAEHDRTLAEHCRNRTGQPWHEGGYYISLAKQIMDSVESKSSECPNNEPSDLS